MANENIVKGLAYRIKAAAEGVWDKCSFWTHASDVFFDDNSNANDNLGAIKGITSDLAVEVNPEKTAVSVKAINDCLGGLSFYEDETGKYVIGADSVPKKLGSAEIYYLGSGRNIDVSSKLPNVDYTKLTVDNFLVVADKVSLSSEAFSMNKNTYDSYTVNLSYSTSAFSKSYTPETGILKITGGVLTMKLPPVITSKTTNITPAVYYIGDGTVTNV